ncbi:DNA-directed RNA polymerases I, II, and III subunit RPABC1-like [Artemia franciscana]|uniref:DNA-directed RNA polymerases I, II, and III subunit RPABC1-like n=1 Tax=Artemia franciscana TaxID=6661 RepID=UPI0032DBD105
MSIYFFDEPMPRREIAAFCRLWNATRAIFIVRRGPISYRKKIGDVLIEYFLESELCNMNDNALVPRHVIISPEDKETLYTQYDENELTVMQADDFAARYYGLKTGQVVKIDRSSEHCVLCGPPYDMPEYRSFYRNVYRPTIFRCTCEKDISFRRVV